MGGVPGWCCRCTPRRYATSARPTDSRQVNRCGEANCGCHAEPPKPHGPYWFWTAKVNGKTVNRRLSEGEARLYNERIADDRRFRALFTQMSEIAAKAIEVIMSEAADR